MPQAESQKPLTAEQLLQRSSELGRCELVKGELVEMTPAGNAHGIIALRLGRHIAAFVEDHDLGLAYAAESGFILDRNPDTVRAPDVAFVKAGRGVNETDAGFVEIVPDLVAEVISPNETSSDVAAKVEDWLHHGCRLVWVADPQTQTVTAYTPDHRAVIYHRQDTLPGGPVLAGFRLALSRLFPSKDA